MRELRSRLSARALGDIVGALSDLQEDECHVALGVLSSGDLPKGRSSVAVMRDVLPRLVRKNYPRPIARMARRVWRELDEGAANDFVLAEVDIAQQDDETLTVLVQDVGSCGRSEKVRLRLEEIERKGGRCSAEAAKALESMFPSDERIKSLQEAWRAERTSENLVRLYYAFMARAKWGETPKQAVVATFGKPDDASGPTIWYSPTEGTSLSFHFERGKLDAAHLT
jgi:hypothetical protein